MNLASATACVIESAADGWVLSWAELACKGGDQISLSAQGDLFPGQLDLKQESALTALSNRQFSGLVKSGFITYFLKDAFFENT